MWAAQALPDYAYTCRHGRSICRSGSGMDVSVSGRLWAVPEVGLLNVE
jgi:hypothetical protein